MTTHDSQSEFGSVPDPGQSANQQSVDLVRRAVEQARAAARASGQAVGQGRASPRRGGVRALRRRRSWSGPRPDERDPQPLSTAVLAVVKARGWSDQVAEGMIFGRWAGVVGADIAQHAVPVALTNGVLSVQAESTAWATQLRMLQAQVLAKIGAAVGRDAVRSLKISGPTGPSWRKGQRHVRGRGPRDTYG